MLPSAARYGAVLAVFRIYAGIFWVLHGWGKLTDPQWAAPGGACAQILQGMIHNTAGPYHDFIANVVLPNVALFATLVMWGETLTGVSLVLGLFSRVGGVGGTFLALNYWAAKAGYMHLDAYAGLDTAAIALTLIHAALPTGRVAGIDALIGRKRPVAVGGKSSSTVQAPR